MSVVFSVKERALARRTGRKPDRRALQRRSCAQAFHGCSATLALAMWVAGRVAVSSSQFLAYLRSNRTI